MAAKLFDPNIIDSADRAVDFITNLLQASTEYSIIGKTLDGTIDLWNEGARRLYGYEPDEVVGKANSSILHTADDVAAGKPTEALAVALRTGKWEGTIQRRRKSGQLFTAAVVITPRLDPSGKANGFLLISRDMSEEMRLTEERNALETQLHRAQKLEALGTLAGGVAHDLNNALVPIVALTSHLLRKTEEGGEVREGLTLIHQASIQARDLVKQILTFARQGTSEQRVFDLGEVVREAYSMLRASVPSAITMNCVIDDVPPMFGDPSQMRRVVVNLVTNAAQAITAQTGDISIRLTVVDGPEVPSGRTALLSVSDTGSGIEQAVLARVFDPFFTTKNVGEGTGLGLAVVHGIVADHGGTIDVQSKPGHGSCFTVYLPVRSQAPEKRHGVIAGTR